MAKKEQSDHQSKRALIAESRAKAEFTINRGKLRLDYRILEV